MLYTPRTTEIQNPEDSLSLQLTVNKAAIIDQIRDAANTPAKKVAKDYYNPTVASLLNFAGEQIKLQDDTILSKTAFADLSRNNTVTGARAREMLMLIFNRSDFFKNFTTVYGDELTIPMDIYSDIPEQLMSTKRIGRQLSATEELDLINVIGHEMYCRHIERQYDIPIELLRNFLYRDDFESIIHNIIQNSIANDFLRLATNGYTDTYGLATGDTISSGSVRDNFYTLSIGHEKLLKALNGDWTNSNGDNIFTGKLGTHLTPNKIDTAIARDLTVLEDGTTTDTSGNYVDVDDAALTFATDLLKVTPTSTSGGGYSTLIAQKRVIPQTDYKVTVTLSGEHASSKGKLAIVASDGTILAITPEVANVETTYTLNFYTGGYAYINVRLMAYGYDTTTPKYSTFQDITIERYDSTYTGLDILNILDNLIDSHRKDYKSRDNVIVMSYEDYEAYGKERRSPTTVVNGQVVGVNVNSREDRQDTGAIPMRRGKRILVNPYKISINEETPESGVYGNIYYGPIKELQIGTQKRVEISREYNSRARSGGAAIEHTEHYYIDFGVRNKEAFSIAYPGAKCETPIVSSSNVGKGTKQTSAETDAVVYPYCDTPGAVIYQSTTESDLDDYDTAVANATLVPYNGRLLSGAAVLADNTYYIRAFRPKYTQPSDVLTFIVASS